MTAVEKSVLEPNRPLLGWRLDELSEALGSHARALSVCKWLHGGGSSARDVPEVSKALWTRLLAQVHATQASVVEKRAAEDGTTKFLISLNDTTVESVLIPARGRSTVCISSQSGCTRHCGFCATATLGFKRQLRADEMLAQFHIARAAAALESPTRNVVFMGMGEPMDNLDEVLRAVSILTQSPAPQLGAQQVTVSTSGILPGMRRFLSESKASLALSLNATTDEQRTALMPQNRTWPIAHLLELLRSDRLSHPRRIHFIEYVLFDGINDAVEDAARLVELLSGINARVNLIPHNPFEGNLLRPPTEQRVRDFHHWVAGAGVRCMVRWPRGRDIAAACGQLARLSGRPKEEGGLPLTRLAPLV